ncbi:MAG TPA: hypothetical protein VG889_08975 [Rhizomicrobium sp.]|nr:hypothetical protein [Rhizomicrobium sp.]
MTFSVTEIYNHVDDKMRARRDVLYGLESGALPGGPEKYLLDSPRGYWTRPDEDLTDPHSWHLFDTIKEMISAAEHSVDVVTMDEPGGFLYSAVRVGLAAIAERAAPVKVRILIGRSLPHGVIKPEVKLKELADDLRRYAGRKLQIAFGEYRFQMASWGHAKFVAVDGKHLITGGHNLWGYAYLHKEPVLDLSMRYEGPIARGAHRFANGLWGFVKKHNTGMGSTHGFVMDEKLQMKRAVFDDFAIGSSPSTALAGAPPMLWVTNPGWGIFLDGTKPYVDNSFVHAFVKAMEGGSWCRLSQQDLAATWRASDRDFSILDRTRQGLQDYPYDLLACQNCYFIRPLVDAMAAFLNRREDNWIELVASPEKKAGRGYTNKIPPSALFNIVGNRMWELSGRKLKKAEIFGKLSRQLYFGIVSFSGGRQTWHTDKSPKYNHAKFWMVDDVFYVGSENFYPSTAPLMPPGLLQEFGVVAQATAETKKAILERYFTPLRTHSVENKVDIRYLTWNEAGEDEESAAVAAGE